MKPLLFLLLSCLGPWLAAQNLEVSVPTIGGGTRTTETTTNTSNTDVTLRPGNTNPVPDISITPIVNDLADDAEPDGVGEPVLIDEGFNGSVDDYLFITNREDFFQHGINLASSLQREGNEDSAANQMKGAMVTVDYGDTYQVRRLFNIQVVLAHLYFQEGDLVKSDAQIVNALTVEQTWLVRNEAVTMETLDLRMKIGHDLYGLEFYTMAGARFDTVIQLAQTATSLTPEQREEVIAHSRYMLARMNTIWGKTEKGMHLFEEALKGGALGIRNSNTQQLFHPADDPALAPLRRGVKWAVLKARYDF